MCLCWFHQSCTEVTDNGFAALAGAKGIFFKCDCCTITTNSTNVDETVPGNDVRSLHSKIDLILKKMEEENSDIKAKLDGIKCELSAKVTDLQKDISHCNDAIKMVESASLTKFTQMEIESNAVHRKLNPADIVVNGLPEGLGNLDDCVIAIGKFYDIPVSKGDVHNVFYINRGKSVVVKFNSVPVRDSIMRKYFKNKSLCLKDVMECNVTSRVYLNDHMTPANSKLNALCKRLLKEKKISKYWLVHSDKPMVKLTHLDGSVVNVGYKDCIKLI